MSEVGHKDTFRLLTLGTRETETEHHIIAEKKREKKKKECCLYMPKSPAIYIFFHPLHPQSISHLLIYPQNLSGTLQ